MYTAQYRAYCYFLEFFLVWIMSLHLYQAASQITKLCTDYCVAPEDNHVPTMVETEGGGGRGFTKQNLLLGEGMNIFWNYICTMMITSA